MEVLTVEHKKQRSLVSFEPSHIYGNILHARYFVISDTKYMLFWTSHAQQRAMLRNDSSPIILSVYIKDMLNDVQKKINIVPYLNGYITLRDFKTNLYAVINIDNTTKTINVITCNSVDKMYPFENDKILQRNQTGTVKYFIWKKI